MLTTPKFTLTHLSTPSVVYFTSIFSDSLIKCIVLYDGAMTRVRVPSCSMAHQKHTSKWNSSYVSLPRNPFSIVVPFYFYVYAIFSIETSAVMFRFDVSALADVARVQLRVTFSPCACIDLICLYVFKLVILGCNMEMGMLRMCCEVFIWFVMVFSLTGLLKM